MAKAAEEAQEEEEAPAAEEASAAEDAQPKSQMTVKINNDTFFL